MMSFEFHRKGRGRARNTHQGNINAIRRSARHHSQYAHHTAESRSQSPQFTTAISRPGYTLPYVVVVAVIGSRCFAVDLLSVHCVSDDVRNIVFRRPAPLPQIGRTNFCAFLYPLVPRSRLLYSIFRISLCLCAAVAILPLRVPHLHRSCFCKAANRFIASSGVNVFKSAERRASTTEASIAAK